MLVQAFKACIRAQSGLQSIVVAASLPQLGDGSALARSLGETSTSYSNNVDVLQAHVRGFAAKPGGRAETKKPAAVATPVAPSAVATESPHRGDPRVAVARLREVRVDPMSLLTEEQLQIVNRMSQPPPPSEDLNGEAVPEPVPPGIKALGLPLNTKDVVSLLHQSLSNMAGHNVHFRPFFFSNIFQSAPVVASYVAAALEADNSWQRIERFFISSIDGDRMVKGIKVRISGRLGRKAGMASIKEWQYGDHSLETIRTHVDYGAASAVTRMGVTGVKVWLRYHESAIPENYFTRKTGFAMPLSKLLSQPCERLQNQAQQLPTSFSSAWWSQPGPAQPLQNRTWQAIWPESKIDTAAPVRGGGLPEYLKYKRRRSYRTQQERMRHLKLCRRKVANSWALRRDDRTGRYSVHGIHKVTPKQRKAKLQQHAAKVHMLATQETELKESSGDDQVATGMAVSSSSSDENTSSSSSSSDEDISSSSSSDEDTSSSSSSSSDEDTSSSSSSDEDSTSSSSTDESSSRRDAQEQDALKKSNKEQGGGADGSRRDKQLDMTSSGAEPKA